MAKNNEKIIYAFLATFFTIIGFAISLILKKNDKYVMFYAKQGLVLFIFQLLIYFINPYLFMLQGIVWLIWFIFWIITWINSLSGDMKKTFLIGDLAKKIKI